MGALFGALVRFIAWSGVGYVANDVYDYVMVSKQSGSPVSTSGVTDAATSGFKSFFTATNLIKVAITGLVVVILFLFVLPKFFPSVFKKLKRTFS